jgi:hypothetical protein
MNWLFGAKYQVSTSRLTTIGPHQPAVALRQLPGISAHLCIISRLPPWQIVDRTTSSIHWARQLRAGEYAVPIRRDRERRPPLGLRKGEPTFSSNDGNWHEPRATALGRLRPVGRRPRSSRSPFWTGRTDFAFCQRGRFPYGLYSPRTDFIPSDQTRHPEPALIRPSPTSPDSWADRHPCP